jgi:hypothetical protein
MVQTSSGLGLLGRQLGATNANELGGAARSGFLGGAVIGGVAGLILVGLAYLATLLVDSIAHYRPFILEHWWIPPVALGSIAGLIVGWILTSAVQKSAAGGYSRQLDGSLEPTAEPGRPQRLGPKRGANHRRFAGVAAPAAVRQPEPQPKKKAMKEDLDGSDLTHLGPRVATYRYNLLTIWSVFGLLGIVMGPFMMLGFIEILQNGDLMSSIELLIVFTCGLIWFLYAGFSVWAAYSRRVDKVDLHENGLSFRLRDLSGNLAWDQVSFVRHVAVIAGQSRGGNPVGTNHSYVVGSVEKSQVVFDEDLRGILKLGRAVQANVQERLLQKAIASLLAGEQIDFGPLVVTKDRVKLDDKTVSWNDVESIELAFQIHAGSGQKTKVEDVVIRRTGTQDPWAVLPVSQVPNEFVLTKLALELGPNNAKPGDRTA